MLLGDIVKFICSVIVFLLGCYLVWCGREMTNIHCLLYMFAGCWFSAFGLLYFVVKLIDIVER